MSDETRVSSSTPTSAIIYDAYTSLIKKKKKTKKKKASKEMNTLLKAILKFCITNQRYKLNSNHFQFYVQFKLVNLKILGLFSKICNSVAVKMN